VAAGAVAPVIQGAAIPQEVQSVRVVNTGQQQPIRAFITNSDLESNEAKNRFLNGVSTF
jgi:hypothetical protein